MTNETFEIQSNGSLRIKEAKVFGALGSVEIRFQKTRISTYENGHFSFTKLIKTPYFFIISIEQISSIYNITISNFNDIVATFKWQNIATFPQITDAFSIFYNIESFEVTSNNPKIKQLGFRSIKGRKSNQLFKIINNDDIFVIEFFDKKSTKLVLDFWNKQVEISINQQHKKQIIPFSTIQSLVFYLDRNKQETFFNKFTIEIFKNDKKVVTILETDMVIDSKNQFKYISWIAPNLAFNAVMRLLDTLRSKDELVDINIGIAF